MFPSTFVIEEGGQALSIQGHAHLLRRATLIAFLLAPFLLATGLLRSERRSRSGLEQARRATVVVLATCPHHPAQVTGVGFVVAVQGRVGYVLTGDDVASFDHDVEVVFDSRTREERRVPARIVDNIGDGLAVLRIEAEDLPAPIVAAATEPSVGSSVQVCGFWQQTVAALAVHSGRVTKTDVNKYRVFDVECESEPYLIGGPVLDTTGALVGVSWSLSGRTCEAFPARLIPRILAGGVRASRFSQTDSIAMPDG